MVFHIQNLEDLRRAIKGSIDDTNNVPLEELRYSISAFLDQTGLLNESLDVLKDELKCAVCIDIPIEACLTECHHVFCYYCLYMWLLSNKNQCPMCRTTLPDFATKLYRTDLITKTVMSKHDSQYKSRMKQEKLERLCKYNTKYVRCSYDTIVDCMEKFKSYHNDEKLIEEISNLSQKYLALLKELPRSEADVDSFHQKKKELGELSKQKLKPFELLGYIEICHQD